MDDLADLRLKTRFSFHY